MLYEAVVIACLARECYHFRDTAPTKMECHLALADLKDEADAKMSRAFFPEIFTIEWRCDPVTPDDPKPLR